MARKKTGGDAAAAATPRKKKKKEPMPAGTFAAKLRVGPVTEQHMQALALQLHKKVKKTTRNDMRAYLHNAALTALLVLGAVPAAAVEDDLLS
jgi:hypothetical protein